MYCSLYIFILRKLRKSNSPVIPTVPNCVKSVSWCRLRGAHNWFGETVGGREIGMGRGWGVGGQFTSNLGPGWTRIAPHKEEGFQVSKRDPGKGELSKDPQGELARGMARGMARGIHKGLCHNLVSSTYKYVSWYCVNVANKRIVFRL